MELGMKYLLDDGLCVVLFITLNYSKWGNNTSSILTLFIFMNNRLHAFEGNCCYCYAIKVKCRALDKKNSFLFRHSKVLFISNESLFKFFLINYYHIITLPVDLIPQSMNLKSEFLQKKDMKNFLNYFSQFSTQQFRGNFFLFS
jgi:hypothetical protein